MGLFNLFNTNKVINKKSNVNKQEIILDFEDHLSLILRIFMQFKDVYLQVGDRVVFSFVLAYKETKYSDSYYTLDYYLKVKVFVSDWWKGIINGNQEVADTFENVFNKKEDENTFICDSVLVGSSTCCFLKWDEVDFKLQKFLDCYEREHPGVVFDRISGGGSVKFGDWK